MKGYSELSKLNTFSIIDVEKLTNNRKTAYSIINRLIKKNMVRKIRNNVYSCVNPATGLVIASRYQIACAVNTSAYISHHSAFEYYGLANQVYYDVYISSNTKFRDFEFEGISYKYISSKLDEGIIEPKNSEGVRITDLERTVIDNIKDFDKIGGFEELLNCLEGIHYLNEDKLKKYLLSYDLQILYQKVGFILNHYKHDMQISDNFIEYCKSKIGKSTRYLLKEFSNESLYNNEWKLVIPLGLFHIGYGGDDLV